MRKVLFEKNAYNDFNKWETTNSKIYEKIQELIRDILKNPHKGLGMPEPLKYELKGYWSRRISKEHRLVYRVTNKEVIIISCKYHYN